MQHGAHTNDVFKQSYTFTDGLLHPGDEVGLGVELHLDAAARYPYQRAYLPTTASPTATIHDW